MSDRIAAEITIGGRLRRKDLRDFLGEIAGLGLDHGDTNAPVTEEALCECLKATGTLRLCDDQARYGEFEDLEGWLREHKIPYCRESEAKYEWSACVSHYRPDLFRGKQALIERDTTHNHQDMVKTKDLRRLLKDLQQIVNNCPRWSVDRTRRAVEALQVRAQKLIPAELPPLPKLEIVD